MNLTISLTISQICFTYATVCYAIYVVFLSGRYFHMLQLNSYMNDRFLKWFSQNMNKEVVPFLHLFRKKMPEKKKFVVTDRVKRLYATLIVVLLIISAILEYLVFSGYPTAFLIALFIILVLLAEIKIVFVLAANTLNLPLEKAISSWYVKDAKKLLRSHSRLVIIGVTGSYGKTSSKYVLSRILSEKFNVLMTPESYNTTLGVVRTVREQLKPSHEVFIVEMGAKKKGDIKEICDLVRPKYGILTSIGLQHLETFKSFENIINTKFELVDSLPSDGKAFLNFENEAIRNKKHGKDFISYGIENKDLKYWAENINYDSKGISFTLCSYKGERIDLVSKLLGRHNVLNIAGASAIAMEIGVEPEKIQFAVKQLIPVPHRLELKKQSDDVLVIDDAFNSNPEGASEALNVLGKFENYNKILVTPGMIELGEKEYQCNFDFAKKAAGVADYIILVGQNRAKPMLEGLQAANYDEKKMYVAKNLKDGLEKLRTITVKGSIVLFENDLPDNYEG